MFLFPVSSISGAILDNITQFLSNYNLEKDTDRFSGKCNVVENRSWWMRDNFCSITPETGKLKQTIDSSGFCKEHT